MLKLVLNDSKGSFNSSENFDSSSNTKKISQKDSSQSKQKEKEKENKNNNQTIISKNNNNKNSLSNKNNSSLLSANIENILYNQKNISRLMKKIFYRVLCINNTYQSYDLFSEKLSSTELKFYDNQFPPNLNSLIKGYKSNTNSLSKYRNIMWKRESELHFFQDTEIFPKNGIFSKNIVQGPYTNNNFLSAILALSKYPKIIRNLFLTEKKNKNGIFGLKICKNGFLQEIIIDDYFPVLKSSDYQYCYTHSKDNTLWVQILEKAYAKIYGSYEILSNKDIEGILKDLSFAPVLVLDSLSSDLASNLTLAIENKWIVMACAGDTDASQNLLKELDLKPDFNYEILDVFKLGVEDLAKLNYIQMGNIENVQFVLKIRNIWGKIEWEGEWSNKYKFWDDNLKKKLKYEQNNNDQIFYMNLRDFKNHFFKIKICKLIENFKYKSLQIQQKIDDYALIKINVGESNIIDNTKNCFISLIQEEKEKQENIFSLGRIILCKIKDSETKEVEYIKGKMGQEREIFIEFDENMIGGEYLIYCELDEKNHEKKNEFINYIISVYSSEEINIEQIDNYSYQNILEKIYISCAKKKKINLELNSDDDISINNENNEYPNYTSRINSFKKIKIKDAPKITKYSESTIEGFSYIYIENLEQDVTLIEKASYQNFVGYKLLPPYEGTSFYVEVKPGECKIIIIKRMDLIESNKIIVFYRSNLLYGNDTLCELTKKRGRKKKRLDKKTGKKLNINIYIFKHDFGICFLYRNKTDNMILNEKIKIENNINIEFEDENKNKTGIKKKEIKIILEPHKDYFLNLKSKNFLWKVNPIFTYTIDVISNAKTDDLEENRMYNIQEDLKENDSFIDAKNLKNLRDRATSIKSVINEKIEFNKKIFDKDDENDNDNEESIENNGDSSDINLSDDNSDESL